MLPLNEVLNRTKKHLYSLLTQVDHEHINQVHTLPRNNMGFMFQGPQLTPKNSPNHFMIYANHFNIY
jgi:hypothetical protein